MTSSPFGRRALGALTLAAVAYVLLFLPFVIASRWLEARFARPGS